jgi:hypothetical protein
MLGRNDSSLDMLVFGGIKLSEALNDIGEGEHFVPIGIEDSSGRIPCRWDA